MFLGRKMKVERAAGNTGGFDDRVDICRARAGALKLDDRGVEHPRARSSALGIATGRSVWHGTILPHLDHSLTSITQNGPPGGFRRSAAVRLRHSITNGFHLCASSSCLRPRTCNMWISLSFVSERARSRTAWSRDEITAPDDGDGIDEYPRSTHPVVDSAARGGTVRDRLLCVSGLLAAAVPDADTRRCGGVLPRPTTPASSGVSILCNLIACSLVPLFAVTAVQMSRATTSSPRPDIRVHDQRRHRCDGLHPGRLLLGHGRFPAGPRSAVDHSAQRHGVVLLHRASRNDHGAEPRASH